MKLLPFCAILLGGLVLPGFVSASETETAPARAAAMSAPSASPPPTSLPPVPVVPVLSGAAAGQGGAGHPAPQNETQQYCSNIAAAAADARYAWQRKQLTDLQTQLKQQTAELDAKQSEFKVVLARRDEMMKKANDTVIGLYAHMKADAAATQLAALDSEMAASILSQLNQRQATLILNEIPPEKAARLVTSIASVGAEKKS